MAQFRVPMLEQSVAATPQRVSSPVLLDVADPGAGVRSIGQGLAAGADIAQQVQQDVDSVAITDRLTEFDRRANRKLMGEDLGPIDAAFEGTNRSTGFLQVRGEEASKTSGEVLKEMQKDVDELSSSLTPRQRKAFAEKVRTLHMGAEHKVNAHVVEELGRAKSDKMKAFQSEVLRSIGADPRSSLTDGKSFMVEAMLAEMATSQESRDALVADWMGQVANRQVTSLLKSGATDEAEALFKEKRHLLGDAADDLEAAIANARKSDGKKSMVMEATAQTQKWVKEATPAGGYVDESKVLLLLQATPADDPRREALEVEVRQALQVEDARRKADTQRHREFVWRADLGNAQPPPSSITFLEQFDPDFLRGLKNEREARWRRWKADKDGSAAEKAAAARQQTLDDKLLVSEFASLSPEEQAKTTPEEYSKVLADRFPDFAPSRNGYGAARQHQRRTIEGLEKGDLTQERAFIAEAEREVMPLVTRKGGKVDPDVKGDPRTTISGNASQFFRSKRAALGRDPTPDETQEWLGQLKLQPEVSWGKRPPPAVLRPDFMPGGYGAPLPAKPPAAPATPGPTKQPSPVRQVRRKLPDGTFETKMLFSDGSVR